MAIKAQSLIKLGRSPAIQLPCTPATALRCENERTARCEWVGVVRFNGLRVTDGETYGIGSTVQVAFPLSKTILGGKLDVGQESL